MQRQPKYQDSLLSCGRPKVAKWSTQERWYAHHYATVAHISQDLQIFFTDRYATSTTNKKNQTNRKFDKN